MTMQFKIDTKENYSILSPENPQLDANLAENIFQYVQNSISDAPQNYILQLDAVQEAPTEAFDTLRLLHETLYGENCSFVVTGVQPTLMQAMKTNELHHEINITPSMQEAIDIINMEILERDIFNEPEA